MATQDAAYPQSAYGQAPLPHGNAYASHPQASDNYGSYGNGHLQQQQQNPFETEGASHPYAYGANAQQQTQAYGSGANGSSNPYSYEGYQSQKMNGQQQQQIVAQETVKRGRFHLTDKAKKRLYWMVPLAILVLIIIILFEVYKSDFERWVQPLTNWLSARKSWSWLLPVLILIILSIPPLFGHEVVLIVTGLTFGLGIAIGIACLGTILGEALCFLLFKYGFTGYVDRKREKNIKWEALARVLQRSGFWNVMLIRYSIVPPHLANPLFATTGMSFLLYMASVILSLPKNIVFVALGNPSNNSRGVKVAKVIAVGILVLVTLYASLKLRKQQTLAKAEVRAERGLLNPDGSTIKPGEAPRYPMTVEEAHARTYGNQNGYGAR